MLLPILPQLPFEPLSVGLCAGRLGRTADRENNAQHLSNECMIGTAPIEETSPLNEPFRGVVLGLFNWDWRFRISLR